ncbi:hypothetical protein [Bacillus sp. EB01]|uniref:hypothetical protein n=1 Tax=Bacillus sp. EB01 TaxID=1347086 RepID=UPI0005C6A575|nr:hypothetical protein [Bacillus sp. EB01]
MKKYGIDSLSSLPSNSKRRRVFTFLDTIGDDKQLFQTDIEERFKRYKPNEITIPKKITNVDCYLERIDTDIFYKEIRKIQSDMNLDINNAPVYVGDIDVVAFWYGHILMMEHKKSYKKVSINQLLTYINLAARLKGTVWYIIGKVPVEADIKSTRVFKLCIIDCSGYYQFYKGTLSEILSCFRNWLIECVKKPNYNEELYYELALKLIEEMEKEENYEDISLHVLLEELFMDSNKQ